MTFRQIIGLCALLTLVLLAFSQIVLPEGQSAADTLLLTVFMSLLFCLQVPPDAAPSYSARIWLAAAGLGIYWAIKAMTFNTGMPWAQLSGILVGTIFAQGLVRLAGFLVKRRKT